MKNRKKKYFRHPRSLPFVLVLLAGIVLANCTSNKDWRTARRDSSGIAPNPVDTKEAVLQVYGADAWGWRGWFAIHTWIAAKRSGESFYTVYDVVGWRSNRNEPVMRVKADIPDRYWYGAKPQILAHHQGTGVDQLIHAIDQAVEDYPWKTEYKAFPGPNSNTFVAWVSKQVPGLDLKLPFSAIGSGYATSQIQ